MVHTVGVEFLEQSEEIRQVLFALTKRTQILREKRLQIPEFWGIMGIFGCKLA